jgi:hypothetical protein
MGASPSAYQAMAAHGSPPHQLDVALAEVRAKAEEQRTFGNEPAAKAMEWVSNRIERALREESFELLSLEEASCASGFSKEHLARLVRTGRLPDRRPAGSRGRLVFRRSDLPSKPSRGQNVPADTHELASRLYGG